MIGELLTYGTSNIHLLDELKKLNNVHVRVQQRASNKYITTIEGLNPDLDFKKIIKEMKKRFSTNGNIIENEDLGKVIQLQGNLKNQVKEYLIEKNLCEKDGIKLHG